VVAAQSIEDRDCTTVGTRPSSRSFWDYDIATPLAVSLILALCGRLQGMKSIEIPDGSLILDTNSPLSDAVLKAVAAYRDPEGRPVFGIARYVSLYKINLTTDISPAESRRILAHVPALGLVQHCLAAVPPSKTWTAVASLGTLKGQTAKRHADLVDYPSDSMLAYDNEDCTGDVKGEITAWVEQIARPPLLYTGYAPGLTPEELWLLDSIHCYWGAAGNWGPTECGVAMRQHYPPITIGGVEFDWNIASADALGRRVVLATAD